MKFNRDKHIGRVLFVVEGSKTEFALLRRIFCNIMSYTYIERRRNKADFFISKQDIHSQVAVINTKESNIKDISENQNYLDQVMDMLRDQYSFPVDQSAIFYLFDRDPKSNLNVPLIENYIQTLTDPYDNGDTKAGQLLLSYPSIESYLISNFIDDTRFIRGELGSEAKGYVGKHRQIQMNKLSEETLVHAAIEFTKYLADEGFATWDIDNFSGTSLSIFHKQEGDFVRGIGFKFFSMLTLAFLELGLLEM